MDSIVPGYASTFIPIQTFIFKVASRCNLNCAYCYMYNKGDLSYLQQPRVMPVAVVDAAIERIRTYSSASGTRRAMRLIAIDSSGVRVRCRIGIGGSDVTRSRAAVAASS